MISLTWSKEACLSLQYPQHSTVFVTIHWKLETVSDLSNRAQEAQFKILSKTKKMLKKTGELTVFQKIRQYLSNTKDTSKEIESTALRAKVTC